MSPETKESIKQSLLDWLLKQGVSTVLLCGLCYGLVVYMVAPLVKSHQEFLSAQVAVTKASADALGRIEASQQRHTELLTKLLERDEK
jgi:hypothetical protein